jgi:hypothetical protein
MRTGVLTHGVTPSLHVYHNSTRIKQLSWTPEMISRLGSGGALPLESADGIGE